MVRARRYVIAGLLLAVLLSGCATPPADVLMPSAPAPTSTSLPVTPSSIATAPTPTTHRPRLLLPWLDRRQQLQV